jgi:hypothetical protein
MVKTLLLAWWLTYSCWYGPDDMPIAIFAGPFLDKTDCTAFQKRMGFYVGALVLSETDCHETNDPKLPPRACMDDKKED